MLLKKLRGIRVVGGPHYNGRDQKQIEGIHRGPAPAYVAYARSIYHAHSRPHHNATSCPLSVVSHDVHHQVMGKNGPKLKPVAADAPRAQSIEQLTGMLSGDSTGR